MKNHMGLFFKMQKEKQYKIIPSIKDVREDELEKYRRVLIFKDIFKQWKSGVV